MKKSAIQKFRERVEIDLKSGCWIWIGDYSQYGTPHFFIDGKTVVTRGWIYLQEFQQKPPRNWIKTHCNNERCVRPDHLIPIERDRYLEYRQKITVNLETACWEWSLGTTAGYGRGALGGKGLHLAHRFMYELEYGPIPDGLEIDHLCLNKRCCRPDHLEAVTKAVNAVKFVLKQELYFTTKRGEENEQYHRSRHRIRQSEKF